MTKTNPIIEYTARGRLGHGTVTKTESGARVVRFSRHGKAPVEATSQQIDLRAICAESLKEALNKACHSIGFLPIFEVTKFNGPKALVLWYHRATNPGYALVVQKGAPSFKIAVSRIQRNPNQSLEQALEAISQTGHAPH